MNGYQKRTSLKQIEGWTETGKGTLDERLDNFSEDLINLNAERMAYEFIQENESNIWQVTHSLGSKYPSVHIIDIDKNIIIGNINYITDNYLEIEFSTSIAGIAYIRK